MVAGQEERGIKVHYVAEIRVSRVEAREKEPGAIRVRSASETWVTELTNLTTKSTDLDRLKSRMKTLIDHLAETEDDISDD